MSNLKKFSESKGVSLDEVFILVLGEPSTVLPGKTWKQYFVLVNDSQMECYDNEGNQYLLDFDKFDGCEFGIGSGNLWLQSVYEGQSFVFCSPRKFWKSKVGHTIIDKLNGALSKKGKVILDMKAYKQYTGKLFFIYMFK